MRATDRMELVSRIGRELQSRYTFDQINDFLGAYKVRGPEKLAYNSKWRDVREALQQVDNGVVLKIAEDLDLDVHEAQVFPCSTSQLVEYNRISPLRQPRLAG